MRRGSRGKKAGKRGWEREGEEVGGGGRKGGGREETRERENRRERGERKVDEIG